MKVLKSSFLNIFRKFLGDELRYRCLHDTMFITTLLLRR